MDQFLSAVPTDTRPAALILFSGPASSAEGPSTLEKELEALGFRVVALDLLSGHDLSSPPAQQAVLVRVRRAEFIFVFAGTPCAPYSIARGGPFCPPLHTSSGPVEPCPTGWADYRALHDDFLDFTCTVFRAASTVGSACVLENPACVSVAGPAHWAAKAHHGSIFTTEAILELLRDVHFISVDFAQCAFGGNYRKWTKYLYTADLDPFIHGWSAFGCTHGFGKHPDVAYGRDELGAAKSARAAAYPKGLNQATAAIAAAFAAPLFLDPPALAAGVGRAADGPKLSKPIRDACDAAAERPARFSSSRNLRPASDDELRLEPIIELAPPPTPFPRRAEPLANGWPPGWEARRPIKIEQLYRPGVYAQFELWLEDSELELTSAAAKADLPPSSSSWQEACTARRDARAGAPLCSSHPGRTYTIPAADLADGAELCTWDTADRDDCRPVEPSTGATGFPGELQLDRARLQEMADALGWTDFDITDQICGGGLEARTGCPRDTVVSRHHPGFFTNFPAAVKAIAADLGKDWARQPAKRAGARVGHLPYVPCHADPRDVIMRMLTRVLEAADGTTTLEDYPKARVSTNLSKGGEASVNAGCAKHDTEVGLPTVPEIARMAAVCDMADTPQGTPRLPRTGRHGAGFYALDLASAYRYVVIQLLDLWCHTFMWLDADGCVGIGVDLRLCFGGAYGPNRFERITTLIGAFILLKQDEYDAANPYPNPVQAWRAERRSAQRLGALAPGGAQLSPKGLRIYLDDYSGVGLLHPASPPDDCKLLIPDAAAMRALGLTPAPLDSRLVAHASIAARELERVGLTVATDKTMIGSSIIALGLQPDVDADTVSCPTSKRRLLLAQIRETVRLIHANSEVERKGVERLTGRLCNISQVLPEIAAELHGGYVVANARRRGGPAKGSLLARVSLPSTSPARASLLRLCAVADDALDSNAGVALAPARRFQAPGDAGVLTTQSDASGDIAAGDAGAGGFSFHPTQPLLIYITSGTWPDDIAAALAESALEPHLRSGAPRFSMPAAELFTAWATAEAAFEAGAPRAATSAIIAIGDCQPAANALNRASSPVHLMRGLLHLARATATQWLGVQVPRELNLDADLLSHPSNLDSVLASIPPPFRTVIAPIPKHCWTALRALITASDPSDSDF